jgi:thioredoxin-like negative regulator of GroEL
MTLPLIAITDTASFDRTLGEHGGNALVLFGAPWCRPALRLAAVLEGLVPTLPIPVLHVDVDRAPSVAPRFGVFAVPSLILLRSGLVAAQRSGELGPDDVRTWLEDLLAPA